jgi:hypothetical protein
MPLPKIDHPIHTIKVPSQNKKYKFRPFLVKEEKLLLMAKESKNAYDILIAIKQIVNNCSLDDKFNIDKLALFDLEYVFLKLRAVSVDNTVNVTYRDKEDNKLYSFEVNLDEVDITVPRKVNNLVKLTEDSGITLRYPPATLYDDKEFLQVEEDHLFEMIIRCVDTIYSGDEVFESSNMTNQEIGDFLETLDLKAFKQIQEFLSKTPTIRKELEYTNEKGRKKKIVLRSLNDFFTWR